MSKKTTRKTSNKKSSSKNVRPMFWIYGNSVDCNRAWDAILSKFSGEPQIEVFYCGSNPDNLSEKAFKYSTASDIIGALKSKDIFSSGPRVLKLIGIPEDYKIIQDYLHLVDNDNVLVIMGRPGYPGKGNSTRWVPIQNSKFYKEIKSSGTVLEFVSDSQTSQNAVDWLSEFAKNLKIKIKSDALEKMVGLKGLNIDSLSNDLLKINTYCSGNISVEDVEECCSSDFLETVWQFIESLDYQNADDALSYLQKLYRDSILPSHFNENIHKIIGALKQHFTMIIFAKDSGSSGFDYKLVSSAVEGFNKVSKSTLEDLNPVFTKQYLYSCSKNAPLKSAINKWKLGLSYAVLKDLHEISFLIRKNSSNRSYQELCLNTFVMFVCGKMTISDTVVARGVKRRKYV